MWLLQSTNRSQNWNTIVLQPRVRNIKDNNTLYGSLTWKRSGKCHTVLPVNPLVYSRMERSITGEKCRTFYCIKWDCGWSFWAPVEAAAVRAYMRVGWLLVLSIAAYNERWHHLLLSATWTTTSCGLGIGMIELRRPGDCTNHTNCRQTAPDCSVVGVANCL